MIVATSAHGCGSWPGTHRFVCRIRNRHICGPHYPKICSLLTSRCYSQMLSEQRRTVAQEAQQLPQCKGLQSWVCMPPSSYHACTSITAADAQT